MQGSVWGGLKCTATMDKLNKLLLQKEQTSYFYLGGKNIPIGALGMIDDTLSISNCGGQSVKKNAVINSFIENQRLTLSYDKSSVIHVGNARKCKEKCPVFKVHIHDMKKVKSVKYLGDKVT